MGVLDGLIGTVIGNMMGGAGGAQAAAGGNPLMNIAFQLMQRNGGLNGLLDLLGGGGLAKQAASWVGTGPNSGISADQIMGVLGSGVLGQLGKSAGMNAQQVSGGLAQMLPELINQMTPHGTVPDNHNDMISQALAMLKNATAQRQA